MKIVTKFIIGLSIIIISLVVIFSVIFFSFRELESRTIDFYSDLLKYREIKSNQEKILEARKILNGLTKNILMIGQTDSREELEIRAERFNIQQREIINYIEVENIEEIKREDIAKLQNGGNELILKKKKQIELREVIIEKSKKIQDIIESENSNYKTLEDGINFENSTEEEKEEKEEIHTLAIEITNIQLEAGKLDTEITKILEEQFVKYMEMIESNLNLLSFRQTNIINTSLLNVTNLSEDMLEYLDKLSSMMIIYISFTMIFCIFFAAYIYFGIRKPLKNIILAFKRFEKMDLSMDMKIDNRKNEFSKIHNALKRTMAEIKVILTKFRDLTNFAYNTSIEISEGSSRIAQNSEEESTSIQHITTHIDRIKNNISKNQENIALMEKYSQLTYSISKESMEGLQELSTNVIDIDKNSNEILSITEIINDIAFQTNILSLNAAVEAAKAGDRGRGFAVVANEIQNLSETTNKSAKEINELISETGKKVKVISILTGNTEDSFKNMMESLEQLQKVLSRITEFFETHKDDIEEISEYSDEINKSVQEGTEIIAVFTHKTNKMKEEASYLQDLIKTINLDDSNSKDVKDLEK